MNYNEVDRIERAIRDVSKAINESFKALEGVLQPFTDPFINSVEELNENITSGCGCCCGKSTPDTKENGVKIVSWAEGNYDEIGAMLDAHYAGKINIADYWHIGDIRVEYMSEIPESNGFEHHAGHDIELVIVGFDTHIILSGKTVAIMVMVKDGLSTMGPMNTEPFSEYSRKQWLNNEFLNSLPIELNSRMNNISRIGERVILPSFNEMQAIMNINSGLLKFAFIDAWTRDEFPIYNDRMSYVSSVLDKYSELRKSYSLPYDQRNIVPMFCL